MLEEISLDDKVFCITIGKPIETDAVLESCPKPKRTPFKLTKKDGIRILCPLDEEDAILGFGEQVGGINKRGSIFEPFCSDDYMHTPKKRSLYAAHNFFIHSRREQSYGLFIDYPGPFTADFGMTHRDSIEITIPQPHCRIYLIEGDNLMDISRRFLKIIGPSYIPPKWGLGYQQCRWSYPDKKTMDEVLNQFEKNELPIDALYMDIDYMVNFKDFTLDEEAFPQFPQWVQKLKDRGIRLIPIIDAGVKAEKDFPLYEEGIKEGHVCLDKKGKPFLAAVWPGHCVFPDFLQKKTRRWWGEKYQWLLDQGIEGFWNDMNEPAFFYQPDRLAEVFKEIAKLKGKELDIDSYFQFRGMVDGLQNSREDYGAMYHGVEGPIKDHLNLHNLYGYMMTRAAGEYLHREKESSRHLLFSRASYIGSHRYGGIWFGDNQSWWEHLEMQISMLQNVNLCGFFYSGADLGGFMGDSSAELLIRWTQLGVFTPLMRNHAGMGTRQQEPYAFDDEATKVLRDTIKLRYALLPYIYSEYLKAVLEVKPLIAPLVLHHEGVDALEAEDQFYLGESLMAAPVYQENHRNRRIYLCEEMLLWKTPNWYEGSYEILQAGHHSIPQRLEENALYIRKNSMIILEKPAINTLKQNNETLHVLAFVDDRADYRYLTQRVENYDFSTENLLELHIHIQRENDGYTITAETDKAIGYKLLELKILDSSGKVFQKIIEL